MVNESKKILENSIQDPEKFYKNPELLLSDKRLTQEQKDKILHSWELDQLALLRAEEENMIQKTNDRPAIDLLEKIKAAEKTLEKDIKNGKLS